MASSLGVPNKISGNTVRLQTLLENVMQVFRQSVDALQEQDFSSGGEHPAVQRIMQDVQEFGRRPRELKNLVSAAQQAESQLARKLRDHKLKERVQDILESHTVLRS